MLMALFSAGRYSEGENLARTLTERFSQHGFGWKVWGTLLKAQGRDSDALPVLRQAAKLLPRDAEVQSNLGLVLFDMGKLPEAAACQRRALKIRPEFAEAHYNLANVRYAQGKFAEAAAGYQRRWLCRIFPVRTAIWATPWPNKEISRRRTLPTIKRWRCSRTSPKPTRAWAEVSWRWTVPTKLSTITGKR
ncbi:MAG: tetratricopeptide repeat protein [Candidatus Accumulibacter sp.]|nr:tetratricopeptide repeat protein [Accumulibacter sp.]